MSTTKRAEHKNAIMKILKGRRIILQAELARLLNKDSINDVALRLANEGMLKRVQIKVRGKIGNLTDQWLLYSNDVKYEEVLDFEKGQINKPFVSPLVENHCYTKVNMNKGTQNGKRGRPKKVLDSNIEIVDDESEITESNVIDMKDYIVVNNYNLEIKTYNNEKVVTFKDIDNTHSRPEGTASRNFREHKDRFIENVHYYTIKLTSDEIRRAFGVGKKVSEITAINHKGYLKLTKSFTDDLSWDVQDMLIDSYFELSTIKEKLENNLPIVKQDLAPVNQFDFMKAMFGCIETNHQDIETLKNQTELQAQEIREAKQELQAFKNKLKKIAQ